jgi:hypothetical protein
VDIKEYLIEHPELSEKEATDNLSNQMDYIYEQEKDRRQNNGT